jgi:hypothetical protein
MMPQPEGQRFAHRRNGDGSYDSICTRCLVAVASVQKEEQLRPHESAHVCDPVRLYQVGQGRVRPLILGE